MSYTEERYLAVLQSRYYTPIMIQQITLALDPPFKSYRPDFAAVISDRRDGLPTARLTFWETKGVHKAGVRKAGIAKAALAAKCYPEFKFILAEWIDGKWKETDL